jgi:hypothetical protein
MHCLPPLGHMERELAGPGERFGSPWRGGLSRYMQRFRLVSVCILHAN